MITQPCKTDYTTIICFGILCVFLFAAYYKYIDYQIKKVVTMPEKANKITVKILAAGFSVAYVAMLLPTSKETLDFDIYTVQIRLYFLVRAVLFLGMIGFGLITGGTFLSKLTGKQ